MPFRIVYSKIEDLDVQTFVYSANTKNLYGKALYSVSNPLMRHKLDNQLVKLEDTQVAITPTANKIYVKTPLWHFRLADDEAMLYLCYKHVLDLAVKKRVNSIAFPLLSTGEYGYPNDVALKVALKAISDFLNDSEMMIYLVLKKETQFERSAPIFSYIDAALDYEDGLKRADRVNASIASKPMMMAKKIVVDQNQNTFEEPEVMPEACYNDEYVLESALPPKDERTLDELISQLSETFQARLLRLIDQSKKSDAEIYKKANIDRKHFSKIRSDEFYHPNKNTVIAFAFALQLSEDETIDLLQRAGYALSRADKKDAIIRYFINTANYDLYVLDNILVQYGLKPVMGV